MSQVVSTKVPFTTANVSSCICPTCPVQAKSSCTRGKMSEIKDALKKIPLMAEDIPAVYCATGKATCRDIDTRQSCICPVCPVFDDYKLANGNPVDYYCKAGAAK